jgi:uncharacterized protein (DUF2147 family)
MKTRTFRRPLATAMWMWGVLLSGGVSAAPTVEGTWIVKDDVALNIFECGSRFCARIVWVKDSARRSTQCGRTIAWGLQATAGNQWGGGSILDPDDENVYRLAAEFGPDGTLRAHIFKGISLLGKTETLRRIDVRSLPGPCGEQHAAR